MSLKNLTLITIIIALSTLMAKVKTTNLRLYDRKYGHRLEHHKFHYHNFQTRHHNHLHKKHHHKCNLDRLYNGGHGGGGGGGHGHGHGHKKQSRYPTLDKIVNRLDNQIDRGLNKLKLTTPNPFENWNFSLPEPTEFSDKRSKYSYITVGLKNNSGSAKNSKKGFHKKHYFKDDWTDEEMDIKLSEGDDNNINFDESSKGFMQDFTTPSPWDNEQHDVSSHTEGSTRESSSVSATTPSTTSKASTALLRAPFNKEKEEKKFRNLDEKLSSWSLSRLVPRFNEDDDKKKKTTLTPFVAAHKHYEQVLRMGDCHVPKKKVIRVHEVHPDPSKSYSPSCTILHQCGDDTGCCRDLKQVCKPKNTTKVELYFFTTTLGKPQTVEKLYFVNHTECECQRRMPSDESMPRDSEFRRSHLKKYMNPSGDEEKKAKNNCTCPSRYSTRYLQNGTCICDCFDKQDDCLILKKGKTHFTYNDKLCIQQGDCLLPTCEFGSYIKQFGRCPNRSENYHYSWSRALSYRDLIT